MKKDFLVSIVPLKYDPEKMVPHQEYLYQEHHLLQIMDFVMFEQNLVGTLLSSEMVL